MRFRDAGVSLLELTAAMALTLMVAASVFAIARAGGRAAASGPETADMQQRLRVAAVTLIKDLTVAGAGLDGLPAVLPFRQGAVGDDPAGTFRADTVTLIHVPATVAQTTLSADVPPGSLTLPVAPQPTCAPGVNLCGFAAGMTLLIFDETGNFGTFTAASVTDGLSEIGITSRPPDSAATTYTAGSRLVQVQLDVYYLKTDPVTHVAQLMHYDGTANAAVPAVDHVVGLRFDYAGEPLGADGAPTPLTAADLTDGPWRPDPANANRWDADLLRIRRVTATLRVESALAALRGPAGTLFTNAGTSTGGAMWAPDLEIRIQVAPRNPGAGR